MKIATELKDIIRSFGLVMNLLKNREKKSLFFAVIIMLFAGALTNFPAVILGKFVDKIISVENATFDLAVPFLISIAVVIIAKEALTVVRKYMIENVVTQTEKKLTTDVVGHLLKTDLESFISTHHIGSLHGRIFRSTQGFIRLLKLGFLDFFPTFFAAFAAIVIAFYQKSSLATVMILVVPAGLFIVVRQIASQKGIRVQLLRGKEKIDGTVVEMLSGLEMIRVSNTVEHETQKVSSVAERLRKIEIKHHIAMAFYDAAKYLNEAFFYVLVVGIAVYFAVNGVITKGDILTYAILFMSVTGPLRTMHRILDEAHESSIKVGDLSDLMNQPKDVSFLTSKNSKQETSENIFVAQELSFCYNGEPKGILNNVNLAIQKGEKIGIAGASGCGKSTLIKIILRLIHNYDGSVQFLGKNLIDLSRSDIAKSVAYIPQKTYLFSGTIRENVIYGASDKIEQKDVVDALKKANIHDEVMDSLGGLDGALEEGGNNLSGGQKQRLALARINLQSPEVLIFDEATSALDNTNESVVQKNLEEQFADKTIITIAHRLTTLKNCDRIIVFDKGSIVQEGAFDALAQTEGLFKKFLRQHER